MAYSLTVEDETYIAEEIAAALAASVAASGVVETYLETLELKGTTVPRVDFGITTDSWEEVRA